MTAQRNIEKAMEEIKLAEEYSKQAAQKYYSAWQRLASVYSSAGPKRVKKGLSNDQMASVLFKRNKNIHRQKPAV